MAGKRARKYWSLCDDADEELAAIRLDVGGLRCLVIHEGVRLEHAGRAGRYDAAPACIVPVEILRDLAVLPKKEVAQLIEWVRRNVPEL